MEEKFYALILKSSESHTKYWICYHLTENPEDFEDISCYRSETLALPKNQYKAHLIENLVKIKNCISGNYSDFAIYGFTTPINQLSQFNLALR